MIGVQGFNRWRWACLGITAVSTSVAAQFSEVITVPPDPVPSQVGSNTQLNIEDGASIGTLIEVGAPDQSSVNAEANISGGFVFGGVNANAGSTVNILAGSVGSALNGALFEAKAGSVVNISGGWIGNGFVAGSGSEVNVSGGTGLEQLTAEAGSTVNLLPGGVLGRSTVIGDNANLNVSGGELFDVVLNSGSRTVVTGGFLGGRVEVGADDDSSVDVQFEMSGGVLDRLIASSGAQVSITGGRQIEDGGFPSIITTGPGSDFTMSGGAFEDSALLVIGGHAQISGGTLNILLLGETPAGGAVAEVTGGSIREIQGGSQNNRLTISGGTHGSIDGSSIDRDQGIELVGGEFRLNGQPLTTSTLTFTSVNDVLTGTHPDGSVFVYAAATGSAFFDATITSVALPPADPTPIVVDSASASVPAGLRAGQSLTVTGDGALGTNFAAVDASLVIDGGAVGDGLSVTGSQVQLNGGSLGESFLVGPGSVAEINAGSVGAGLLADVGGTVNLNGGQLGGVTARDGGTVNIRGGEFLAAPSEVQSLAVSADRLTLIPPASVSDGVSVGLIETLAAEAGGTLNLFGSGFLLDGVPLNLNQDESRTITERGGSWLAGRWADGSLFSLPLSESAGSGGGFVAADATLTLTAVAGPIVGDLNADGFVSQADLDLVLLNWGGSVLPAQWLARDQFDGQQISQNELDAVLLNWGSGAEPVLTIPEPSVLPCLIALWLGCRRGPARG